MNRQNPYHKRLLRALRELRDKSLYIRKRITIKVEKYSAVPAAAVHIYTARVSDPAAVKAPSAAPAALFDSN